LTHAYPNTTVLQRVAGKDASKQFWKYHNESILKKYQAKLQVGSLDSKVKGAAPPTPPETPPPEEKKRPKKEEEIKVLQPSAEPGFVAPMPGPAAVELKDGPEALDQYGDLVPFGDPSWYQTVSEPAPTAFSKTYLYSITPHTTTNPTQISAPKSATSSRRKSCHLQTNGTQPSKSRSRFTNPSAREVTSLD